MATFSVFNQKFNVSPFLHHSHFGRGFGQGSLLFSTLKVHPSGMTPLLPHVTGCEDMDNMVIIFDSQNKLFATDFIPFVFNKANI